jgi:aminoglycoside 3-N-acetyltransferase I
VEVEIRKLNRQDLNAFKSLIRVFENVFEMKSMIMPGDEHLSNLLKKQDFFVFAASFDSQVVGGLTAYALHQYHSVNPLAYIYDLAVATKYQRQGIGRKLINAVTKYCTSNGFEEVFVQADKDDDHAIEFYRSTPITNEEQVVHFYYTLNSGYNL